MQNRSWSELPELLTIKEMRDFLKIGTATAYSIAHQTDFPAIRVGLRRILVPKAGLQKWVEEKMRQPA